MQPICLFTPTSNLIVKRSQITLDLVSKDVEKVVFQKMRKSFRSGQVHCLIFTFSVSSKPRKYENLEDAFRETMGKQLISDQTRYGKSDTNLSKITLDLSSKNIKNAFFESMAGHQKESGAISLAFTFTTLSTDPIYEEVGFQREKKDFEKNNPPAISLATHPTQRYSTGRIVSNPFYDLVAKRKIPSGKIREFFHKYSAKKSFQIRPGQGTSIASYQKESRVTSLRFTTLPTDPIYEEVGFRREKKDFKKNHPPPIFLATHPTQRYSTGRIVSNPFCDLVTKRKNPSGKIREFFHKYSAKKSFQIRPGQGTSIASYQKEGRVTSLRFTTLPTDPIYEEVGFRREKKDFKKNNPPPVSLATHPTRKVVSNISNIFWENDPIYENIKERKSSKDSGYETPIPSSKESVEIAFDSGYEIPRSVEPVVYLEVLP